MQFVSFLIYWISIDFLCNQQWLIGCHALSLYLNGTSSSSSAFARPDLFRSPGTSSEVSDLYERFLRAATVGRQLGLLA